MNSVIAYDATAVPWQSHIGPDINPKPSQQYPSVNAQDGSLVTINEAAIEMAGGLVSCDFPLPAGCQYFGMDTEWTQSAEDTPHIGRNEMDLKITLVSGSSKPLPNQVNGSLQWNKDAFQWQLDPSGSTWVNTSFAQAPVIGRNLMQSRFWSDGTKWSCTGLRLNCAAPFIPYVQFQNLPMIQTGWGAGMHPQLQTEAVLAPWFLRMIYTKVLILASAAPISWRV